MKENESLTRRAVMRGAVGITSVAGWMTATGAPSATGISGGSAQASSATSAAINTSGGRLRQSVCRWIFESTPLPELCRRVKQIGLVGIDLLYADEWDRVRDAGLASSLGYASRRQDVIETGFNDTTHHAMLLEELEIALPRAARAGVPSLIAMFGNRRPGLSDQQALDNCVTGLAKIAPLAEEQGVTLCVELLNSKVDHKGYQGDHTAFGVAVVERVNSPRVKLLYDIYHMQIMEGDVIRTIQANSKRIGHFHTGGVPGRHEINATQELNYHAVAAAIADSGFNGFVAHEFKPTRADPFASLAEAYQICSV